MNSTAQKIKEIVDSVREAKNRGVARAEEEIFFEDLYESFSKRDAVWSEEHHRNMMNYHDKMSEHSYAQSLKALRKNDPEGEAYWLKKHEFHNRRFDQHEKHWDQATSRNDDDINEHLKLSQGPGNYVSDFENSDNPKFDDKSKAKRRQMALAAYFSAKKKNESIELEEGRGRPRKNSSEKTDSEPDEHLVVQLRKVISLRGQRPLHFKDGKKLSVSPDLAHFVLNRHNNMPGNSRQRWIERLSSSPHEFQKNVRESALDEAEEERTWEISDIDGKNKRRVTLAQFRAEVDHAKKHAAPIMQAWRRGDQKGVEKAQSKFRAAMKKKK